MALRKIRIFGDEILKKISKPVKEINTSVLQLMDDMRDTMREHEGIGLAAPQVGVLKRIVLIETEETLYELINPEIIESEGSQTDDEACLSWPGKAGKVERPEQVKIKALDREGNEIFVEGKEMLAVALCHEIDHLDGVLFTDRAVEVYLNEQLSEEEEGD